MVQVTLGAAAIAFIIYVIYQITTDDPIKQALHYHGQTRRKLKQQHGRHREGNTGVLSLLGGAPLHLETHGAQLLEEDYYLLRYWSKKDILDWRQQTNAIIQKHAPTGT